MTSQVRWETASENGAAAAEGGGGGGGVRDTGVARMQET